MRGLAPLDDQGLAARAAHLARRGAAGEPRSDDDDVVHSAPS